MSIFNWFTDMLSTGSDSPFIADDDFSVNPANGLPMIGGSGGVDIEGNPFGTDFSHDHMTSSSLDDSCSSSSIFDDSL
jgi:hypothetical protein